MFILSIVCVEPFCEGFFFHSLLMDVNNKPVTDTFSRDVKIALSKFKINF